MSPIAAAPAIQIPWWNGEEYNQSSQAQFKLALELLQEFPFQGNEKVLDVGCGDGSVTAFVAVEKVPRGQVVGIDASASMIASARKNNAQNNINYQEGLAETFNINGLFDVIVSFSTLHWIPDQQSVWANISRHLKTGGHALVSLNPAPRSHELTMAINEVVNCQTFKQLFLGYKESALMPAMTIEEYGKIVIASGLKVIKVKQSTRFFQFQDVETFTHNLKAWLPHVSQVPETLQMNFVRTIVSKFLGLTNQKGSGPIRLDYNNFIIRATK